MHLQVLNDSSSSLQPVQGLTGSSIKQEGMTTMLNSTEKRRKEAKLQKKQTKKKKQLQYGGEEERANLAGKKPSRRNKSAGRQNSRVARQSGHPAKKIQSLDALFSE